MLWGSWLQYSLLYGLDPHCSRLDDCKDLLTQVSQQAVITPQNPCSEVFSCAVVAELANRSHGELNLVAGSEADNDEAPEGWLSSCEFLSYQALSSITNMK